MSFERMKFKEIINGDDIQYLINDKFVTEEIYNKILNDEALFVLPPLPKMNGSPENSNVIDINKNNINNDDEGQQCTCEECQELLEIIYDIREMDDNKAFEGLSGYVEAIKIKTQLETMTRIYGELGNNMIRNSVSMENQLKEFMSQFDAVDEEN